MALDTNQYRTQVQIRVNQLLDEKISPEVRLHIADVALGLAANLCDEIDALRDSRARVEAEAAETIGALRAEVVANEAAMERLIEEAIGANAELDAERQRMTLHERLLAGAEAEVARLRDIIRIARERLYDAHGRDAHNTYLVIGAVGKILRRADATTSTEAQ